MNPGVDTHRNTPVQTHTDQWRPGPCVTTVLPPGWIYTSLIIELWLVHHGEKSLYYDKMHKGPLRAETLSTGHAFCHRICILCMFLFSHQTKIITWGCEKTFVVNCFLFQQSAVNVRRMLEVHGHKCKYGGKNSQNCRFGGSIKHSERSEDCSSLSRRLYL